MVQRDMVVVGGSAGGTETVTRLVRGLPAGLPAAFLIVIHFPPETESLLPRILSRAGQLPAVRPEDGDPIAPGRIYVARPGLHLQVDGRHIHLTRGPKENNSRPSIDTLFRSAARAAGPRCIILSGNLDDGTAGLASIKRHGGVALVQAPETAPYPGMPRSAIDHVAVDHIVPVEEMPALLTRLITGDEMPREIGAVTHDEPSGLAEAAEDRATQPGTPSTMSCPECHGTLWEAREGELAHWSRHAEALWGLRAEEVHGQHLLNLDIGLPMEQVRPALKACLGGDSTTEHLELDAVNRRGKTIRCAVTCTPLQADGDEIRGAILLMEELPRAEPGSN